MNLLLSSKIQICNYQDQTEELGMPELLDQNFNWEESICGKTLEALLDNAPSLLGKHVTAVSYYDTNLFHNTIAGRTVTDIFHFPNKTPINWYSKKQVTAEMATYRLECSSVMICVKQIADLRTTLYYFCIPIRTKSFVFGNNCSIVDSSMTLYPKIWKKYAILPFDCIRKDISAKVIRYYFISSKINLASILGEH